MQTLMNDIRAAYPALGAVWDASPDSSSAYSAMELFARFVVDAFERGERDALRPAFDLVERGLVSASPEVCDLLALEFLEDVQNIASHRVFGAEAFVGYLGANSRQAWNELNVLWAGKESLAEVVASERGASLQKPWWQFWRRQPSPKKLLANVENPELRALIEGMTREHPKKK